MPSQALRGTRQDGGLDRLLPRSREALPTAISNDPVYRAGCGLSACTLFFRGQKIDRSVR
jgi:hypothetical protein